MNTSPFRDNSTDQFNWEIRLGMKAPNAAPASWWPKIPGNGGQYVTPRRATSLVLTHLAGPCQVNPVTILNCHDRAYPLTYKMFLQVPI